MRVKGNMFKRVACVFVLLLASSVGFSEPENWEWAVSEEEEIDEEMEGVAEFVSVANFDTALAAQNGGPVRSSLRYWVSAAA